MVIKKEHLLLTGVLATQPRGTQARGDVMFFNKATFLSYYIIKHEGHDVRFSLINSNSNLFCGENISERSLKLGLFSSQSSHCCHFFVTKHRKYDTNRERKHSKGCALKYAVKLVATKLFVTLLERKGIAQPNTSTKIQIKF